MLSLGLILLFATPGVAGQDTTTQNSTTPGTITTPFPTIRNLAVEWTIDGDDNLNGVVMVRYRKMGHSPWREAMPLRRVPAATRYFRHEKVTHAWKNKHSGSLFDLEPDTAYEIRLQLTDPDGGSAKETVLARTRPLPCPAKDATMRRGTPATIGSAQPGDVILLMPGDYGDFCAPADGTPDRPIVYRSANGTAVFHSISLRKRKHVHLDGISIKNDRPNVLAMDLVGAEDCVVQRCTVQSVFGICAQTLPGAKNCYIADNIIQGVTPWTPEAMGAAGKNIGEGIQLTGPGNVICYNRVSGFRDCISTMEGHIASQACIDIYHNDIYNGADDGIEADFCKHNCRILRNRLTNCYVALSSQPGLGGPTYFIRNAAYNAVHSAFKLKRNSVGDVVLHNTILKVGTGLGGNSPMDHAYFRNNLCIGGSTGDILWGGYGAGRPMAADVISPGENSSFDYDAVGVEGTPYRAEIGRKPFSQVEPHGIRVEMRLFRGIEFPNPPVPERTLADLRPRPGSKVEDAALRIPNVNDDYLGNAPDIGAYESGQELPQYGPRP